jgi:hypothetical protein
MSLLLYIRQIAVSLLVIRVGRDFRGRVGRREEEREG